jgi:hypothetical protein
LAENTASSDEIVVARALLSGPSLSRQALFDERRFREHGGAAGGLPGAAADDVTPSRGRG